MKKLITFTIVALVLFSCEEKPKSWQLSSVIETEGVNPIGITETPEGVWLSDGDHKRVVLINENGSVVRTIDSLERPMHISADGYEVVIPLYGEDAIVRHKENIVKKMRPNDSLDAPAGVWREGNTMAIADFYNHRIVLTDNGLDFTSFGKEGKGEGEFYYPTDVQFTKDHIWVADAYNNRVQRFDRDGNFQKMIGEEQKMNAATGIYISGDSLFVTDFENNRVLVFDLEGNLKQEISEAISKPTDMIVKDDKLYIANYKSSSLAVYEWKAVEAQDHSENHEEHTHEHD